ncbi:ATP-binding cassette domain-containing protein [Georgenia sp. 10Sc9-8]|uniref:ATP-binding cassette domain-containing protein n=1 Tax=Georgenia halotolerans TaxID=3028317 RepID=A0ABT5U1B7_9MICO|nr:ATP-binding cassette domain-containing protein [Georgenia halotolerans]
MTQPQAADAARAAATEPVLTLADVSVHLPRRRAPVLSDVSTQVAPGEHMLVLGASGSGKSTLLQVITGVVPHTVTAELTGEVTVAGTTGAQATVVERSRYLGVLAQDPGAAVCLPQVEQEVALPLENHAVDPAAIEGRLREALRVVGAEHLRDRGTAGLSGGESQRVALAAALVTEPDVLLLDEPTSMLDPAGITAVRTALRSATERYGPAVVLVEHRLDEWTGTGGVAGLPARTLVLGPAGQVLADGPTTEVLHDQAGLLHAAGCWLPLDAELHALTGSDGGLAAPRNTALLENLAEQAGPPPPVRPKGVPVLVADGLAVGRGPEVRERSRGPLSVPALLAGVDLEVLPGEVVALLGANGIGKSTLLLTLAGLLDPVAGRVSGARPGLVFQNAEHQFLAHSVQAEISHGLPPESAEDTVTRQLRRHRLEHLAEQNPFRLSGGEKRRLSLAAMLAHDRPCLLADEPTLGLDRRDTITTSSTLRQVADEGGAVVLASHDIRTVVSLADRVVLLAEGGVLAAGPPAQVLAEREMLVRAGITLPPLVAWLLEHVPGHAVRPVLRALDEAVAAVPAGDEPR